MNQPNLLLRRALLAVALGAGSALAQTAPPPTPTPPVQAPPVMSDVGPPPAEDRSSAGAVVLEKSLVQAQRDSAFERSASRSGVATVGRGVLRSTMRARTEAELAQAREAETRELKGRGAGSLIQK
jgi:hypothetical protein